MKYIYIIHSGSIYRKPHVLTKHCNKHWDTAINKTLQFLPSQTLQSNMVSKISQGSRKINSWSKITRTHGKTCSHKGRISKTTSNKDRQAMMKDTEINGYRILNKYV